MPKFIVTLICAQTATIIVEAADECAAIRLVHGMPSDQLLERAEDWTFRPGTRYVVDVNEWPEEADGR